MFAHMRRFVRAQPPGIVMIESDPNAARFSVRMRAVKVRIAAPVAGDLGRVLPVFTVTVDGFQSSSSMELS